MTREWSLRIVPSTGIAARVEVDILTEGTRRQRDFLTFPFPRFSQRLSRIVSRSSRRVHQISFSWNLLFSLRRSKGSTRDRNSDEQFISSRDSHSRQINILAFETISLLSKSLRCFPS